MQKHYNPHEIEQKWYQFWEDNNYFAPNGTGKPYCIMIPPPNVTGTLHMGHAFQYTIMDGLIRYHKMKGDKTLWQMGTDHAGIATQMVVERQLEAENKSRHDIGREAFIDKVWDWKEHSGNTISQQLRRMGCAVDWSRERFTMDEGLSEAVRTTFVRLYDEGLIYRGKRLVNWDPVLHTAVSDLEVISTEENGHMWHMRYPLADGSGHLTVATTRPETMLGDTAVAVHPADERYQHLVDRHVILPLTGREIPIIADDYVDIEFGTGCVKITPAHDFNDYEMGQRHNLVLINVLTENAQINDEMPVAYRGMDRYVARQQIVGDLEKLDLLVKVEAHQLKVPRGDRSGAVIEPFLTDQWYVKTKELAAPALQAVQNGDINFVPDNWKNTYYRWLEDIQDWCVSRQIWWGHRIPAWYDMDGKVYVGHDEKGVRAKYKLSDEVVLTQDDDVLDTWFSSALWPFSTLGWPDKTTELATFYPTNVLVTGFDIIFFWVARMIMFGLKLMDDVPFHEIYIHGLVRDSHGAKMSKSKGNVLDPLDLIDGITLDNLLQKRTSGLMQTHKIAEITQHTKEDFPEGIAAYGTDALRFTFASLASTGRDINFDLGRVAGYRNFCNKLWNAARFVLMQTEGQNTDVEVSYSNADLWINSQLQHTIKQATAAIEAYRFDLMAQSLYEFVWNEYCDWYLELAKIILNSDADEQQKQAVRQNLLDVMSAILRLLHPLMPFISDEIWHIFNKKSSASIMLEPYPEYQVELINDTAENEITWLKNMTLAVRQIRGEMNIAPSKKIPLLLQNATLDELSLIKKIEKEFKSLAKLESINIAEDQPPESAVAIVGTLKLLIPMSGLIDKQAELTRLTKELTKLEGELKRINGKLSNANFVDKAPAAVVAKEREKLQKVEDDYENIRLQRDEIKKL